MGVAPVVAFVWAGCSEDPPTAAGRVFVDPGGTHGAEISITVKGRGRVTANTPGLDCPSDCFAKYVFENSSADGAAGGITLKATPTPGLRFLGWSFETEPGGSRGRGPEPCNPITRPATQPPGVNSADPEITLPFGEVDGTPPEGQQAACGAYTKVPVLYRVTASFETDEKPGIDGGDLDAGDAGATGEIVYEPPQAGATAHQIGITQGRLYWVYRAGGYSGIAYGATPSSAIVPQTPQTVLSPSALETVSQFEVEQYGVVYQTDNGVYYVQGGDTTPTAMGGVVGTCSAVAADTADNVYCRTGDTLVRWSYPIYNTPTPLFTGLPSGSDLAIEGSGTTAYFSTSTAINSLPLTGADGGVATPTTIVSSRINPSGLEANTYLWWVESGSLYRATKTPGSAATSTGVIGVTATSIAPDTSTTYFWAASSTTIYRAYYLGGASTQVFRSGLSGVNGVAADSTYVYWTQSDGRVRRAPRN